MDEGGWVKIHRKIQKWEWFKDSRTLQLFMFLLTSASFERHVENNIELAPGMVAVNLPMITVATGMSDTWARKCLENLLSTGEIRLVEEKSTSRHRVFMVSLWEEYQLGSTQLGSTQLGSTQLGSTQLGSTQLGSTQLGSTQLGSTQLGVGVNSVDPSSPPYEQELKNGKKITHAHAKDIPPPPMPPSPPDDERQKPYSPGEGYGAPPILAYPQSAKEVMDAAALRGIAMTEGDAAAFIGYYGGFGWMVNNNPIRNWTMLLISWSNNAAKINRRTNNGNSQQQGFDRKRVASRDEFGESDPY